VVSPYGSEQQTFPAAISVGDNPTFEGQERRVEAYAIGVDEDALMLYGKHVAVDFVSRLRRQLTFASAAALTRQMAADVEDAKAHLGLI
jgi:riboflavin kinase/FMN adenylyltransferase